MHFPSVYSCQEAMCLLKMFSQSRFRKTVASFWFSSSHLITPPFLPVRAYKILLLLLATMPSKKNSPTFV